MIKVINLTCCPDGDFYSLYCIIVFIVAYFVGAILVKINASQVEFIKRHFEERIKGINQY